MRSMYFSSAAEWKSEVLFDLAEWINGAAFRLADLSDSKSCGKPVIKIAELKSGITGQTKFSTDTHDEKYHVKFGDMLFSWSGSPETSIDVFWWHGPDGWLNQHIFRVVPRDDITDRYLFYLLKYLNPYFVDIAKNKQTTGLGHITQNDLKETQVHVPPLNEQRAITSILGALDDKIELNHRMNQTLESIAQAIFKSWFIDFDPVVAKSEGREPYGMDAETAALFPDSFEESELELIPEGWQPTNLGNLMGRRRENVVPTDLPPDTPYIGLGDMPQGSITLSKWSEASKVKSRKRQFKRGDILFGRLRPNLHKVGIAPIDGICSTDMESIITYSQIYKPYILACVSSSAFIGYCVSNSTGTRMPRVRWSDMVDYRIVLPPKPIAAKFSRITHPMFELILENIHENQTLCSIRDTLLPKLLSGEIRVPEAESTASEVI